MINQFGPQITCQTASWVKVKLAQLDGTRPITEQTSTQEKDCVHQGGQKCESGKSQKNKVGSNTNYKA